jgi:hypothetical protein
MAVQPRDGHALFSNAAVVKSAAQFTVAVRANPHTVWELEVFDTLGVTTLPPP